VVLIPRTGHQPERPSWDCRACAEPWPCAVAKVELAEQYHRFPQGLFLYLTSCLIDIIDDRSGCRKNVGGESRLYDRLVSWADALLPEPGGEEGHTRSNAEGSADVVVAEHPAQADGQRGDR
jgi:hypothetical protein